MMCLRKNQDFEIELAKKNANQVIGVCGYHQDSSSWKNLCVFITDVGEDWLQSVVQID